MKEEEEEEREEEQQSGRAKPILAARSHQENGPVRLTSKAANQLVSSASGGRGQEQHQGRRGPLTWSFTHLFSWGGWGAILLLSSAKWGEHARELTVKLRKAVVSGEHRESLTHRGHS